VSRLVLSTKVIDNGSIDKLMCSSQFPVLSSKIPMALKSLKDILSWQKSEDENNLVDHNKAMEIS